ncbi:heme A synthase [Halarchaeum rubridurum]|uniref:Heme A synthase n=2 Tax=Halarchaeum TaxID=744724 RepID=A0A830G491_9EURY|nr:hypothetical protein [Halarchaeum rubridurum]MBP1955872.1 heme A synthase [Halarchaeum rubridurum]GGM74968.1 hypothetical protein GCM10009017_26160 [Halarchaeum rubridurum]
MTENSERSRRWSRAFRWLVTLSLVGTILLMGAAVYSVALQGWMSCGAGFPKCAGVWAPIFHPVETLSAEYTAAQILAEWSHRAIAFLTGLLMLAASAIAWWRITGFWLTTRLVIAATAVLPFEAWLGVVTGVPNPAFGYVALHTVISLFVLGSLAIATAILWRHTTRNTSTATDATATN